MLMQDGYKFLELFYKLDRRMDINAEDCFMNWIQVGFDC